MSKQMLTCCKVYISESRNKLALEAIETAAEFYRRSAPIINRFVDETYNRVGYTLVADMGQEISSNQDSSSSSSPLKNAVFEMVKAAFDAIDLDTHRGTHPRLGVVDHVCFFPLAGVSLDNVAGTARSLAADVGSKLQVAAYLYGAAHGERRRLASIRRKLGYFKPNNSQGNEWSGGPHQESLPLEPDEGPSRAVRNKGVITIGATQWVDNYNVPIFSDDMPLASRIALKVSGRGGGLESVESIALAHGEGTIEVACNILDTGRVSGRRVQAEVERIAGEEGVVVGEGYYTDFPQAGVVERYLQTMKSSDFGRY